MGLSINDKEYVWMEKFRPKSVEDIVLPQELKQKITKWIQDEEIPNLLLAGRTPGTGKSSLCHVLINEIGADAMFVNSSLESNIDLLRNKIQGFVSTSSFDGNPKIVVLDEADGLNPNSTQPALRAFIEEFSKQARFILTCNDKSKVIEPVRNRCIEIDFDEIYQNNKEELLKETAKRTIAILKHEDIEFEKADLVWVLKHFWPSNRKIIGVLQEASSLGKLEVNRDDMDQDSLTMGVLEDIKSQNFKGIRNKMQKMADPSSIFRVIYDSVDTFEQPLRPQIIVTVAKWASYDSHVRDRLINSVGCAVEIMDILKGP